MPPSNKHLPLFCKKFNKRPGRLFEALRYLTKSFSNSTEAARVVLKNLSKVTGKHRCQSLNKVPGLRLATLLKKRL